jgi:hypothetical protein
MALYERLTSQIPTIWPDVFLAVLQEHALGKMTDAEAAAALSPSCISTGLDASEAAEALAVKNAIVTGNAALMGTTPWDRLQEVTNVIRLAQWQRAPYTTLAAVAARLGL